MTTELGFLIETRVEYGCTYVNARIVAREDGAAYPCNGIDTGCDGLSISGFVSDYKRSDGSFPFVVFEPAYRESYATVDLSRAKKIVKVLTKIARIYDKVDHDNPGEVYTAVAKALGLKFAVVKVSGDRSSYADNTWAWYDIDAGRDIFESQIAAVLLKKNAAA